MVLVSGVPRDQSVRQTDNPGDGFRFIYSTIDITTDSDETDIMNYHSRLMVNGHNRPCTCSNWGC